nr:hypothetical protein B0A51_17716 [Rachicladosporium sp. CCFEE 5018]
MTVFTMKNILLATQLTGAAFASAPIKPITTIAVAPTTPLESTQSPALIPNHVDPGNLPSAWPKSSPSAITMLNHTTPTTSSLKSVHTTLTTHPTSIHTVTTTVATDTYPPGPAAFRGAEVDVGAAAKSSGLTTTSTSSSCTSTKTTTKTPHAMTTTHVIPAPPPRVVTLPVQSQHGGEHHWSGLSGGMVYGTGMAHGTGKMKHWPTQPAGHHGKPPGVAGVHPSGMPASPNPTQSPWEPGHPMGPPPGVSPKEWQQHRGEHGQGWQSVQHPYQGVNGTGTFVWTDAPHTTTVRMIYMSTQTVLLTVFATATAHPTTFPHPTTTVSPLADSDMTSSWTPDVWSSQHGNSTQHKNGPTAIAGDPVWTSGASSLPTSRHATSPSTHTTSTSHHTTPTSAHSTPSTVTTAKPHPLMNTDLAILSSLLSLESLFLTGGTAVASGHAAPTSLPAARANCTTTFTKRPDFFECTSTKYQSTTTTFMDCQGCSGKHVTTVLGKDAHVCPTHTSHITLPLSTKTECYSTRSTTVVIRPTGANGAVLPFSTRTSTLTHTPTSTRQPTSTHTPTSTGSAIAHGTGSLLRPTQLPAAARRQIKRATTSTSPEPSISIGSADTSSRRVFNPTTLKFTHTPLASKGTTKGMVVAVTGTVSGHSTSYITTLEIVNPATMKTSAAPTSVPFIS